jgi:glucose-1-phosphate cytidylyltransferase
LKLVILAGGLGTRLAEEKMYSAHKINEFIICLGYKGYYVKEYFANYFLHMADVTLDIGRNLVEVHYSRAEEWRVTLVDTGADTMTGGRLKRVKSHIGDETFCMTYGDGVGDVDISALVTFHEAAGRAATVTAVRPPGRFGALDVQGNKVSGFIEKPLGDGSWINGGFFVLSPNVIDRIDGDDTTWEREPLEGLARDGQLSAFRHEGFWQPMDTIRDKHYLEELWSTGRAQWKVW